MITIMTMILLMMTTTTMIFPRKRRDIFLLYYVKSECTFVMISSQDQTYDIFPSQLICASRSIAGDLPLFLLLPPGKYMASLAYAHENSSVQQDGYIIFFPFLQFSLYDVHAYMFDYHLFHSPLLYPGPLYFYNVFPFDFYHILSRVTQSYYIILFGDIFIQ